MALLFPADFLTVEARAGVETVRVFLGKLPLLDALLGKAVMNQGGGSHSEPEELPTEGLVSRTRETLSQLRDGLIQFISRKQNISNQDSFRLSASRKQKGKEEEGAKSHEGDYRDSPPQ